MMLLNINRTLSLLRRKLRGIYIYNMFDNGLEVSDQV